MLATHCTPGSPYDGVSAPVWCKDVKPRVSCTGTLNGDGHAHAACCKFCKDWNGWKAAAPSIAPTCKASSIAGLEHRQARAGQKGADFLHGNLNDFLRMFAIHNCH